LNIRGNLSVDDAIWFLLYPNTTKLILNVVNIGISGDINWQFQPNSPLLLLGRPNETRVEIPAFFFSASVKGLINDPEFEIGLGTSLNGPKPIRVIINIPTDDGLISTVLGLKPIEVAA